MKILDTLNEYSKKYKINCFYILHENPNFKQNVVNFSNSKKNFKLIKPMNYLNFINLASRSEFIFTDSGGISEEGPSLKKKNIYS